MSVFIVNSGGRIVYANKTLCSYVGCTFEEVSRRRVWDLITNIDSESWPVRWQEARQAGSLSLETEYRAAGGALGDIELRLTFLNVAGEEYVFGIALDTDERKRTQELLLTIAGGVSASTGAEFFQSLLRHLAKALDADYATISETAGSDKVRTFAAYRDGRIVENFEYRSAYVPAAQVLKGETVIYPKDAQLSFPHSRLLKIIEAEAYAGTPLKDSRGNTMGLLSVAFRQPLRDPGRIRHLLEIFAARATVEIERLRSRDALLHSEQRFRTLFESAGDAIFLVRNGRVVDCNRKAAEMYGGTREQILEVTDLSTALDVTSGAQELPVKATEAIKKAMSGETAVIEFQTRRFDGTPFLVEASLTRADIGGDVYLLAVAKNVTEHRRTERALSHLSGRLLQMQDEERRRIARELHDTTGQNLAALQMTLSLALQSASLEEKTRKYLEESLMLTEVSLREMRTLSYLLHPPLLDELGLITALRAYADGYSERTGVRVILHLPERMERLPREVETALFRIVQEGLGNIHKHSGSSVAILRLETRVGSVALDLIDHGKGMPSDLMASGDPSGIGVGITGMRERARQLGGKLEISSASHGTTLSVVLPLTEKRD